MRGSNWAQGDTFSHEDRWALEQVALRDCAAFQPLEVLEAQLGKASELTRL